jgi:hypothetical protein
VQEAQVIESTTPYQGTGYTYNQAKTVMCLVDKFGVTEGKTSLKVRAVTKFKEVDTAPWKSGNSGVLGLSQQSDLITYLYDQYKIAPDQEDIKKTDFVMGVGVRLNSKKSGDKWEGKLDGTFDGSFMTLNGYKDGEINKENGIKWTVSKEDRWALSEGRTKLKSGKEEYSVKNGITCLDFHSSGVLILPESVDKAKMLKHVN